MISRVLLVRDSSKLSSKVERYFVERNIDYDVIYSDERMDLPLIYAPFSRSPFSGETGFNFFKTTYVNTSPEKKVAC